MAYCTRADVRRVAGGEDKLIALSDLNADGAIDNAVVRDAIDAAEEWINSYVAKKRAVPLSPVPDIIKRTCAEEAVYRLRLGRDSLTDDDRIRHEERRDWLEGVAAGRITLGVDPPLPKATTVMPAVGAREGENVVTRESLKGFV